MLPPATSAQPCGVAKLLKSATSGLHARLEARIGRSLQHPTPSSYQFLLETMYGFYAPLEPRIAAGGDLLEHLPDYEQRKKVHLLERDLVALGRAPATLSEIARCRDLPAVSSTERKLGCLYVLEGATLGGQFISRSLSQNLGLGAANGASFFSGYGSDTPHMWREFQQALERYTGTMSDPLPLVDGARETFLRLESWWIAKESEA